MPSTRIWESVQAGARLLAWLTSVAALVVMAYVINRWPRTGGAVAAAMVGTGVAMLNDSWETVSILDSSNGFVRLSHTRVLMHDLFSLALTVGGIVLILFSESGPAYNAQGFGRRDLDAYDKDHMQRASLYLLAAVVAWRFLFSLVGCLNTSQASRRNRAAAQERRERRMVVALTA